MLCSPQLTVTSGSGMTDIIESSHLIGFPACNIFIAVLRTRQSDIDSFEQWAEAVDCVPR